MLGFPVRVKRHCVAFPTEGPVFRRVLLRPQARIYFSDRIAHLNGNALGALLQQNRTKFTALIWQSLGQCVVQAALAPSLR